MSSIVDKPFILLGVFLIFQWGAAYLGDFVRARYRPARKDEQEDLDIVRSAVLTLLALIVGFSFSMAVSRYDLRKNYEEAEANAIGTAYARADLLATESAAIVRDLIRKWLKARIAFYEQSEERQIGQVDHETEKLQAELWSAVLPESRAQPTIC